MYKEHVIKILEQQEMLDSIKPKHAEFLREWMKDQNGTRAAIAVGYSPGNASHTAAEILKRPEIKAIREEIIKSVVKKTEDEFKSTMEMAFEAERFATETGNANAKVKAVELIAKMRGDIIEKHEVRGNAGPLVFNIINPYKKSEDEMDTVDTHAEEVEGG